MAKKKYTPEATIDLLYNQLMSDYKGDAQAEAERQRQKSAEKKASGNSTNSSTSVQNTLQSPSAVSRGASAVGNIYKAPKRKYTTGKTTHGYTTARSFAKDQTTKPKTSGTRGIGSATQEAFERGLSSRSLKENVGQRSSLNNKESRIKESDLNDFSRNRSHNQAKILDKKQAYVQAQRYENDLKKQRAEYDRLREEHPTSEWLKEEGWGALTGFNSTLASTADWLLPDVITPKPVQNALDYYKREDEKQQKKVEEVRGGDPLRTIGGNLGVNIIQNIPAMLLAPLATGETIVTTAGTLLNPETLSQTGNAITRALYSVARETGNNPMFWETFLRTAGPTYDKEIESGADPVRATLSALTNGLLNAQIEIGGGIEKFDPTETFWKALRRSGEEEGLEEIQQYAVEGLTNKALGSNTAKWFSTKRGEDAVINPIDMAEQGAYGALAGGLMGGGRAGVATLSRSMADAEYNRAFPDSKAHTQDLVEQALMQAREGQKSSEAEILATNIQNMMEQGEEVPTVLVRQLHNEVLRAQAENERDFSERKNEGYQQAVSEGRANTVETQDTEEESRVFRSVADEKAQTYYDTAMDKMGENASERSARAISKLMVGVHTNQDIDTILIDKNARNAVEEMTGIDLPIKNTDAREILETRGLANMVANRDNMLQETHNVIRSNMRGREGAVFEKNYDNAVKTIGVANAPEIYESVFSRFKNAGMVRGSDFDSAYDRIVSPLTKDFGEELGGRISLVFNRDFAHQAFDAGRQAYIADEAKTSAREKAVSAERAGTVTYKHDTESRLSTRQKKFMTEFAKRAKLGIEFYDGTQEGEDDSANGYYENGVIHININSTNKLITVAKHELTHHIKVTAPEMYRKLEDFVIKKWYNNDPDAFDERILEYQRKWNCSVEVAYEEIIANASEAFFTDRGTIDDAIKFSKKLGHTIHDGIRTLLDTFLDIQDTDRLGDRGYGEFLKELNILKDAQRMWLEALDQSVNRARGQNASEATADDYTDVSTQYTTSDVRYSRVDDKAEIARLEAEPSRTTYRAMALINGKLYPPMATKIKDANGKWKLQDGANIGDWLKSDITTDPSMFDSKGRFHLKKDNGDDVFASYNPYIHSSDVMLNDQFATAYKRPNIVVVEGKVPRNELTNGTRTEHDIDDGRHVKAKDPTGTIQWKAGVVQGKLTGTRTVFLTNHFKPTRIVPESEVARNIQQMLSGTDVAVPYNVVTPSLRYELEKIGVKMEQSSEEKYHVDLDGGEAEVRRSLKDIGMTLKDGNARWTDERIDYLIDEFGASNPDYSRAYAVLMNPRDFLKLTLSDEELNNWNERSAKVDPIYGDQRWLFRKLDTEELKNEKQTPFLEIYSKDGTMVQGHEGRHRMRALLEAGVKSVPVVIRDTDTKYTKKPMGSMTLSAQDFGYDPVNNNAKVTIKDLVPIKESNRAELVEKFGGEAEVRFSKKDDQDYLDAVNRGDMETAQRMVDEYAKKAGYDVKAYHGTSNFGFTKFSTRDNNGNRIETENGRVFGDGFYFTDNKDVAEKRYANVLSRSRLVDGEWVTEKTNRGVYNVYLNLGNNYVLDWNDTKGMSQRDFDRLLRDIWKDHNSLTIKNVRDGIDITSTVYVVEMTPENAEQYWDTAWSSSRIKSADPVTYDDNGNVIPLSERFNDKNEDIRYSHKDSDGRTLTEAQVDYFKDSKARDKDGNLLVMYHGSPNRFTIFDIGKARPGYYGRGFYFTDSRSRATQYGNPYTVYLDVKNPLTVGSKEITRSQLKKYIQAIADNEDYGLENYGYGATVDSVLKDVWGRDDFSMLQDLNATAVGDFAEAVKLFNDVNGTDYDGIVTDTETVVFRPEQIKETENKNPSKDADIRFSKKADVEETQTMIAWHNINSGNINGVLELGGLAMPSFALRPSNMGFSGYGDISIIADKRSIDPKAGKSQMIFGGDAWTPMFPPVDIKIDSKVAENLRKRFYGILGFKSSDELRKAFAGLELPALDVDNLADQIQRWGDPYSAYGRNDALRLAYVMNGMGVQMVIPMKQGDLRGYDKKFWELVDERIPEDVDLYDGNSMQYEPALREAMYEAYGREFDERLANLGKLHLPNPYKEELSFAEVDNILYALRAYRENGIPDVVDIQALEKALGEKINEEDYRLWIDDLFEGIVEKRGIRNDKDLFTPSGSRRGFDALHYEYNLENIVKAMKSQSKQGNTSWLASGSNVKGASLKSYNDIEYVRNDLGRIVSEKTEEVKALYDQFDEQVKTLANKVAKGDPFTGSEILADVLSHAKTEASIFSYLNREYSYLRTQDHLELKPLATDIYEIGQLANTLPMEYFEAKVYREFPLQEALAIVVPDTLDSKIVSRIKEHNVNVLTYEAGNDEDRLAKVNSIEGARFSKKETDGNAKTIEYQSTIRKLEKNVEGLKAQFKRTNKKPNPVEARRQAGRLIQRHASNMSIHEDVTNTLTEIYEMYAKRGAKAFDDIYAIAERTAVEIVNNISEVHFEGQEEYNQIKDYLRDTDIVVSEEMKRNITDFNDFRKSHFGKLKLVNGERSNIDSVYAELSEMFPSQFTDDYVNPADQLNHIADVLDSYAPFYETLDGTSEEMQDYVVEVASDLMETAYNLQNKKTFADKKYDEKVKAVKKAREKALANKREALSKMRNRYRQRMAEAVSSAKAETREAINEKSEKKRRISQIAKTHARLTEKLLKPSDTKHLPDGYNKIVADVLGMFDFTTRRQEKWEAKWEEPPKRLLALRELRKTLQNYAKAYESGNQENVDLGMEVDPDLVDIVDELEGALGQNVKLADLDSATLEDIATLFRAFEHQLNSYNKAFNEEKMETISQSVDKVVREAKEQKHGKWHTGVMGRVFTSNMNPSDFFTLMGGEIEQLYKNVRKGFDKYEKNLAKAKDFIQDRVDVKTAEKWANHKQTFTTTDGEKITLTDTQLMSLYCLMKREQAQGHIFGQGIVSAPVRVKDKIKAETLDRTRVQPTPEDVTEWLKTLSKDQIKFADAVQKFFVDEISEWGNETSMTLYGYKKFTEKNYFPIQSSQDYLNSNFDSKGNDPTLKNISPTKALVKGADNPLMVDDIFSVFAKHTAQMASYNAYVPSITDFQRVWNYKTESPSGRKTSTQEIFRDTYGDGITRYVTNFFADLNGVYKKNLDISTGDKMFGLFKKSAVGGNLRVLTQQPMAIARAMLIVDPLKLAVSVPKTAFQAKKTYNEMLEHCPIAEWKTWGFYSMDIAGASRDLKNVMIGKDSVMDKVFMNMYGVADNVTWTCIFNACKMQVEAENKSIKKGTPEYWDKVNELASEVFDRTQVVDSPFHRSELMKSQDTGKKYLTMFMAEPTKTINMLNTELTLVARELADKKPGKATARFTRLTATTIANAMLLAVGQSVIDAMRSAGGGSDDDDKGDFEERFKKHWMTNTKDNLNVANMIPLVKDVVSLVQGYGVTRPDMMGIEKCVKAMQRLVKYYQNPSESTYAETEVWSNAVLTLLYAGGVPLTNARRDLESIALTGAEAVDNPDVFLWYMKNKYQVNSNTKYIWADAYFDALDKGNTATAKKIYNYMIQNGVTAEYIEKRKKTWEKHRYGEEEEE